MPNLAGIDLARVFLVSTVGLLDLCCGRAGAGAIGRIPRSS